MRRLAPVLAAALLLASLSACSAGSGAQSSPEFSGAVGIEPMVDASGTVAELNREVASAERSVIRNGYISLEVSDPTEAVAEVTDVAEGLGGFVESESLESASAMLVLRVPADVLDEAFAAIGEVGEVRSQSRSANDVTEQHVDLQARVEALEQSVERLRELMAGSATTGELIEAETALAQRQQELDGLRAQLQSLESQVAQATISVSLSTTSTLPGGPDTFWDGLVAGWESLAVAGAGALVVFGVLLPWLVLAGLITLVVVLIVRGRRRAKQRRSQQ